MHFFEFVGVLVCVNNNKRFLSWKQTVVGHELIDSAEADQHPLAEVEALLLPSTVEMPKAANSFEQAAYNRVLPRFQRPIIPKRITSPALLASRRK